MCTIQFASYAVKGCPGGIGMNLLEVGTASPVDWLVDYKVTKFSKFDAGSRLYKGCIFMTL